MWVCAAFQTRCGLFEVSKSQRDTFLPESSKLIISRNTASAPFKVGEGMLHFFKADLNVIECALPSGLHCFLGLKGY